MRLAEICVQRPVFAFMLILFLVVLGVSSFTQLGVDLFPRSDPATVSVRVELPGASPEEVTSQVVMPLEEAIASVSGIDEMQARVSEGTTTITVTFVLERNITEASDDVREKVSGAMRRVENVAEFNDVIVKNVGGSPIRLRDLGYVEDGMAEKRTFAQLHGQPAVTLEARRQTGTNTVQVVDAIKQRIAVIQKQLPRGVSVEVVKDQATYIKNSVKSLEEHLVIGSLLA